MALPHLLEDIQDPNEFCAIPNILFPVCLCMQIEFEPEKPKVVLVLNLENVSANLPLLGLLHCP